MDIFLVLVILLFILGIIDLTVGVANDAVNFTNSAIGSRAATRRVILIVAAVGVLLGAISSGGLMEVARKGIFNPEFFSLNELMMIFITVMLTDIILLDVYNTFGLPTSTTVSLVSELLGAALFLGFYKMANVEGSSAFSVINSASALKIITGIMLSVFVAFTAGIISMFIFRTIFTFDIKRTMRLFGGVFSGLIFTTVIFFVFIGALKGSDLIPEDFRAALMQNLELYMLACFIGFSILFQILALKGVNIFRINILVGTGALAMAFASNDLVNFIGVPLAGFNTFQLISANGNAEISGAMLAGKVATPGFMLLLAGLIMIITLFFSKKAESVTKTEVSLSSTSGNNVETFEPNNLARIFVQMTLGFWGGFRVLIPGFIRNWVNQRFNKGKIQINEKELTDEQDFDQLRASVNIMTASALILYATLSKLPLSTTFVTFMVAMGSSLTDRAWGRENAVHRVSGVLTVVGGWFFTAIIASVTAGLIITLLYFTEFWALLVLVPLAIMMFVVSGRLHRKRSKDYNKRVHELEALNKHPDRAVNRILAELSSALNEVRTTMDKITHGVIVGKRKPIKNARKSIDLINHTVFVTLGRIIDVSNRVFANRRPDTDLHGFSQANLNLKRVKSALNRLRTAALTRVDTYHTGLNKEESGHVKALVDNADDLIKSITNGIEKEEIRPVRALKSATELSKLRINIHKDQMERSRKGGKGTNNTLSYLVIIDELTDINEELVDLSVNLGSTLVQLKNSKKAKTTKNSTASKKKSGSK
ncbi:MAG: inorganic phosphate transporter [Leptospiraceae bacterium]|nr:inorganic phosphate transporter [Leptospiraceae bacterium]